MISDKNRACLVEAAWAAIAQAYLTKEGGTRYGAAVLTSSGKIFTSGQYSTWNHITNIHAEQGALLIATMAGEPYILALAVASTGIDEVTRPCGVCRQIIYEHATQIHRNFEVLMARRDGRGYEHRLVSELLPFFRSTRFHAEAAPIRSGSGQSRSGTIVAGEPYEGQTLVVGDQVILEDETVAVVFDPQFEPDTALVKIKYAPPTKDGRRKVSNSFTEAIRYEGELYEMGWTRRTRLGAKAAFVGASDIKERLPSQPLDALDETLPNSLLRLFHMVGIALSDIKVTGSRAIGLHHARSDWDIVVTISPDQIECLRDAFAKAVSIGKLEIPNTSGTWHLLDRLLPKGRAAIIDERRFLETIRVEGCSVAMILVPPDPPTILLDDSWESLGRMQFHGIVVSAEQAAYKRAIYTLDIGEGTPLEVVSYSKAAHLLKTGDRIAVRGWGMHRDQVRRLVQIQPFRDNIVWLAKGS